MIRFDSNNIAVGEIKQLLKNFNLPKATVLQEGKALLNNKIYIDDDVVYRSYYDTATKEIKLKKIEGLTYDWGDRIQNITHNFNINSNIYDSNTHRYLGNYLRFLRDYKHINLMSMYNCFSNESPSKLNISFIKNSIHKSFNSADTRYRIYMVPVKLGQVYTLSLTSSRPVEMVCGYYANNFLLKVFEQTYRSQRSCVTGECFLYDALKYSLVQSGTDDEKKVHDECFSYDRNRSTMLFVNNTNYFIPPLDGVRSFVLDETLVYDEFRTNVVDETKYLKYSALSEDLYNKEDNLYLFIKVSSRADTSITVLEGDYTESDNVFINKQGYTEIKYKPAVHNDITNRPELRKHVSRLQLISEQSGESYPFADKLIQYLFSNVITDDDAIMNNVKKAQTKLHEAGYIKYVRDYGTWTDDVTAACLLCSHNNLNHREVYKDYDCIGYLDSDIESELGGLD